MHHGIHRNKNQSTPQDPTTRFGHFLPLLCLSRVVSLSLHTHSSPTAVPTNLSEIQAEKRAKPTDTRPTTEPSWKRNQTSLPRYGSLPNLKPIRQAEGVVIAVVIATVIIAAVVAAFLDREGAGARVERVVLEAGHPDLVLSGVRAARDLHVVVAG